MGARRQVVDKRHRATNGDQVQHPRVYLEDPIRSNGDCSIERYPVLTKEVIIIELQMQITCGHAGM